MLFSAVFSQISGLVCIINTSECSKIIRFCSTENYVIGLNIGRLKIIPFRLLLLPLRDFLAGEERFRTYSGQASKLSSASLMEITFLLLNESRDSQQII